MTVCDSANKRPENIPERLVLNQVVLLPSASSPGDGRESFGLPGVEFAECHLLCRVYGLLWRRLKFLRSCRAPELLLYRCGKYARPHVHLLKLCHATRVSGKPHAEIVDEERAAKDKGLCWIQAVAIPDDLVGGLPKGV